MLGFRNNLNTTMFRGGGGKQKKTTGLIRAAPFFCSNRKKKEKQTKPTTTTPFSAFSRRFASPKKSAAGLLPGAERGLSGPGHGGEGAGAGQGDGLTGGRRRFSWAGGKGKSFGLGVSCFSGGEGRGSWGANGGAFALVGGLWLGRGSTCWFWEGEFGCEWGDSSQM